VFRAFVHDNHKDLSEHISAHFYAYRNNIHTVLSCTPHLVLFDWYPCDLCAPPYAVDSDVPSGDQDGDDWQPNWLHALRKAHVSLEHATNL
jgi:hypothetical protein